MEASTCIEAEAFALRVTDDSMEPEFAQGCIIIVDPTGPATHGAFVLAEVADEFVFRQLSVNGSSLQLIALNADYPSVCIYSITSSVKGVVTQRAGKRRRYHKRYT